MAKIINHKVLKMDYVEGVDEWLDTIVHHPPTSDAKPAHPTSLLATVLKNHMTTRKWALRDLALALDCPVDIVDMLLTGSIPAKDFDEDLIEQLAYVLDYDPNTLRRMIGREAQQDYMVTVQQKEQEAQAYLESISHILFETLDERYGEDQPTKKTREQYDEVIRELERIIVRMRRDLQFVQSLKTKLQNPDNPDPIYVPIEGNLHSPTMKHMEEQLKRIIRYLGGRKPA
jgi:hypothetical protein